jgi:PAS domain S-box-containing protein
MEAPAGTRRRDSIRLRLAYLVIACVLPVWIAAGFLLCRDYLSRRALTEQRMLETARALTMVVDRELANMQASLSALATTPSLVSGDLPAFYRQACLVMETHPGAYIILADESGQLLINTFSPFGAPLPKRNAPDAVRQVYSTEMPVITTVFKGALSGRLQVSVDVPVFHDGRVIYDLSMTVPADHFGIVLLQQQLPPGWIGSIYDGNRVMVARTRLAEVFVGRQPGLALWQRMRDTAEGTTEAINLEGIPVVNGFSRSAISGWTVVFAVPRAIMMAEIWRWLRWALAGTVLLSLSGIALALPLGRSIEQVERAQRLLAAIVESSDDAIYSKNLDGIITTWNKGAEQLYGYTPAEVVGRSVSLIVPPEHREELHNLLQNVRRGERVEPHETVRMRKDGWRVHVTIALALVKDERGEITGSSVVAHDITRRKQAEEKIRNLNAELEERVTERTAALVASNKELEAFTYSVSHDLRAPLRHIDGFSKILLERYSEHLDAKGCHYLDEVRTGARNMGRLVDELLGLSRVGRQEPQLQVTGLYSLFEEVRSELMKDTGDRQIEWKIASLPFVECDPTLMRQVVMNLLSNAVKYTRPRDRAVIEVGHAQQGSEAVIFVRDNGVGFNMKYADKLFGVFQRLHRAEDFEGTGVGLATVQRIIGKHNGRVWAEAELNQGATFYFTLGGSPTGNLAKSATAAERSNA